MINEQLLKSGHICCGAGGDIVGAKASGISPVWAFDKNSSAVETVLENHADVKSFVADVRNIDASRLDPIDILFCYQRTMADGRQCMAAFGCYTAH